MAIAKDTELPKLTPFSMGPKRELRFRLPGLDDFKQLFAEKASEGRELMDVDPARYVGPESRKSYATKLKNGFFSRFLGGDHVLDIGYKGGDPEALPILPTAVGVDLDYPGYDGKTLPFETGSQDGIHCSHCLEHIDDYQSALREWFRVLKVGGFMVIVVPHQFLYERRLSLPSAGNRDHKRFYTPASLLGEIEESLQPNSYRVRHLIDNDDGYDYSCVPPHWPSGCQEIELVVQKIAQPIWGLQDGTCRLYGASEFNTHLGWVSDFYLEMDFSSSASCPIYGPYQPLQSGNYEAIFSFETNGLADIPLQSHLTFDVAQNMHRVASIDLFGEEGAAVLKRGSVAVQFSNTEPFSQFEFRIWTQGQKPYNGTFRFFGVLLRRLY